MDTSNAEVVVVTGATSGIGHACALAFEIVGDGCAEAGIGDDHALLQSLRGIRNAVMLIRLRTEDAERAIKRKGQESFNFGDLFAYTKVCSHLGCPSSLYEQQTYRILCPCHQSQFDALHFAKPIFGPAARALAQLPITIDQDGYLVANGDFIEPVGAVHHPGALDAKQAMHVSELPRAVAQPLELRVDHRPRRCRRASGRCPSRRSEGWRRACS